MVKNAACMPGTDENELLIGCFFYLSDNINKRDPGPFCFEVLF